LKPANRFRILAGMVFVSVEGRSGSLTGFREEFRICRSPAKCISFFIITGRSTMNSTAEALGIGMLIGVVLFLVCLLLGWVDKMTAAMSRLFDKQ
jgi:hypothetical protein